MTQEQIPRRVEVESPSADNLRAQALKFHIGGKLAVVPRVPLAGREDLRLAYTPGVAEVSAALAADPHLAATYTGKGNAVAVVSDGSAVLGLGDIGPGAALPVMEGKAVLFKKLADVDAYPIVIQAESSDPVRSIVEAVAAIAPGFGGINLEDIAAPRCFEVEAQLSSRVDVPVFHDDQHGTAVVVAAALDVAAKRHNLELRHSRVVISGAGAAGTAITKLLMRRGLLNIVVADSVGVLHKGRRSPDVNKQWLIEHTNPGQVAGSADDALNGAQVFIGVSRKGAISERALGTMVEGAIVFALANPEPEVDASSCPANVAVYASGRSDDPNQINNVLAFPGIFRGLLDAKAKRLTAAVIDAAVDALVELAENMSEGIALLPDPLDPQVAQHVAARVRAVASAP